VAALRIIPAAFLSLFLTVSPAYAGAADFNIDGTYEIALDLPRILFLLKRDPNGPPLHVDGNFELNYAFLDTGASGIVFSPETVDIMGLALEPDAVYIDTGVAGEELFDGTEPLYIGTAAYNTPHPENPDIYVLNGPWRVQRTRKYSGAPIDVLGIPVMAGKAVILHPGATNHLEYFDADIKEPNEPRLPIADFHIPLRFERYIMPENPHNIPPLPVLAYNPVIDNITAEHNGFTSTGSWLFDTVGMVSLISVAQGAALGLTDHNGEPTGTADFWLPIGGIGGQVNVPGFEIDNLIIPTLNGYNLVFNHPRIGVHDIGVYDAQTQKYIMLDGVFGSNFLCATMNLTTWELAGTAFDWLVLDTQNAILGFDVYDFYPLPTCGDPQHPRPVADLTGDCKVDLLDISILAQNWLDRPCTSANDFCHRADINSDAKVDLADYDLITQQWLCSPFNLPPCGTPDRPCLPADLKHDGIVALEDLAIFADEWLNFCDWLNWNCRGADLAHDGAVNLADFALWTQDWLHSSAEP